MITHVVNETDKPWKHLRWYEEHVDRPPERIDSRFTVCHLDGIKTKDGQLDRIKTKDGHGNDVLLIPDFLASLPFRFEPGILQIQTWNSSDSKLEFFKFEAGIPSLPSNLFSRPMKESLLEVDEGIFLPKTILELTMTFIHFPLAIVLKDQTVSF